MKSLYHQIDIYFRIANEIIYILELIFFLDQMDYISKANCKFIFEIEKNAVCHKKMPFRTNLTAKCFCFCAKNLIDFDLELRSLNGN